MFYVYQKKRPSVKSHLRHVYLIIPEGERLTVLRDGKPAPNALALINAHGGRDGFLSVCRAFVSRREAEAYMEEVRPIPPEVEEYYKATMGERRKRRERAAAARERDERRKCRLMGKPWVPKPKERAFSPDTMMTCRITPETVYVRHTRSYYLVKPNEDGTLSIAYPNGKPCDIDIVSPMSKEKFLSRCMPFAGIMEALEFIQKSEEVNKRMRDDYRKELLKAEKEMRGDPHWRLRLGK